MSLFESASLVVTPNGTKASKLYAIKPTDGSGDLSVVRATTATRVNSNGLIESVANNVPRLDYSNGSCPSILVEPQRTNIFTYSEDFSNVNWFKFDSTLSYNVATAPDGTTTADKLIVNNGILPNSNDAVGVIQVNEVASGSYTYSVFAKSAEFSTIRFRERFVTGSFLTIDLNDGAITNDDTNQFINVKAILINNGWYKISFTTPSNTTSTLKYDLRVGQTGNGTSGIYIWGAQFESGSYSTSYIPTTTASVTRNADVISKTGISSLIGQTEGTLFFDLKTIANNNFKRLSINGGSYVNSIFFDFDNSNNLYAKIFNSGSAVATLLASGVNIENRNKIAIAYKNNDFSFYVNGLQVASQTSGNVPSGLVNYEFSLGGNEKYEGNINSAAIWKTRLSNSELATLTTI